MKEFTFIVEPENNGTRLDLFLTGFSQGNQLGLSRTTIQSLINGGSVIIKGVPQVKSHYKLRAGDEITFTLADKNKENLQPEDIAVPILYEDENLIVVNKPSGLVVHPAPGNYEHTLVNALLFHCKKLSDINPLRPGIVHRLDKETSGVMVAAKDNFTHLGLAEQFAEHTIQRKYIAIVKGPVDFYEDIIELPIGRHPEKRKRMAVGLGDNIKYAKTHYRTLAKTGQYSFLELTPFTGRTHQLRVHLSYIGHPILGDTKYGKNNEFSRLALHAKSLGFTHPVLKTHLEFSSELPPEFDSFLKNKDTVRK